MDIKRRRPESAFLLEWLSNFEKLRRKFESSLNGLNEAQLEETATTNEFRTWRLHRACMEHHGLLLKRFVEEDAFATLWDELSDYDKKHDTFSFSGANGGVPATILRRLDAWYRTPKFTQIQLKNHQSKITKTCDDLLYLLRQVTPSQQGDKQFAAFNHFDPAQANFMLRCFQSPQEVGRRKLSNGADDSFYTKQFVVHVLEMAGVTPIAAVEWIRLAASVPRGRGRLPTKLGAKGAKRTYFIHATFDAINNSNETIFHCGSIASNQQLADLVCLIADTDCTADDVRKALK